MLRARITAAGLTAAAIGALACVAAAYPPVPTTLEDFFINGTQPLGLTDAMEPSTRCDSCHGGYDLVNEPLRPWAQSLMGQAMRDPLFQATLAVAERDADFVGDLCLRCHTPAGWLEGRSTPTDGSSLIASDFDGVSCHACHRMVDPVYQPGVSPAVDEPIIAGLANPPVDAHNGSFIIDPLDRRRGPFNLDSFNSHAWLESPFFAESRMCETCHDVSNPAFSRQPDGTYALNALNQAHPTQHKYDMFPVERTYSEWAASAFAQGPIEMGGRFGGNKTAVSTCQDCHMPDSTGRGCNRTSRPIRSDLPTHHFTGGNTWVLKAVRALYPDAETNLNATLVDDAIARTHAMLQAASDVTLEQEEDELYVRITNQTGHKLPTGYPEGRRMWINVQFFDGQNQLIAERGHYDFLTATLTTMDTKVYEAKIGVDAAVSAATGVPEGESFHFVLNNVRIKDNRIPPRGFTNAGFAARQAGPVAYHYDDGQYWDETEYSIPASATRAEVRVYYQTSSREYIEFLRDELAGTDQTIGQTLHDQWVAHGMGAPAEMDFASLDLVPNLCPSDLTLNGTVDVFDLLAYLDLWFSADPGAERTGDDPASIDVFDLLAYLDGWFSGC